VYFTEVDVIGLDVRADNASAIAWYRGLGVEVHPANESRVITMLVP